MKHNALSRQFRWMLLLSVCTAAVACGTAAGPGGTTNTTGEDTAANDAKVTDGGGDAAKGDTAMADVGDGSGKTDSLDDSGAELPLDAISDDCGDCGDALSSDDASDGDTTPDANSGCEFPAKPLPGAPGATCNTAADCDNGLCIPNGSSKICTTTCSSCCPSGFACELIATGTDSQYVCMPKLFALCSPCTLDSECDSASSKGALCVSYGSAGSFCGGTCQQASDCPNGYDCQGATGQAGAGKQCVRTSGECTCSAAAVSAGATTSCIQANEFGNCAGQRKCTAAGLSACNAPTPATETCNGVDDNCDGVTDPEGAAGCATWYDDSDGDLYGTGDGKCLCQASGAFTAAQSGDCNDGSAAVSPAAFDACNGVDDNCNGVTDEAYGDLDGDGIADCVDGDMDGDSFANAADCSPTNAAIFPGAPELCDGLDDDCNGVADDVGTAGCTPYYPDVDGDGAGAKDASSTCLCAPTGLNTAPTASDCNDNDPAIKPGASEICDGADNDCNGQVDEGCDDDGDGWCDGALVVVGAPPACKFGNKDCDDGNAAINPGLKETCGNTIDDNCDGQTDIGIGATGCTLLFDDGDGDGFGAGSGVCLCAAEGLVTALVDGDCNDANSAVKPGATESCNGKDDNCDGQIDEAGASGCSDWYTDKDGDGFGSGVGACLCGADSAHPVNNHGDCDDSAVAVSPAATETCNGIDDNCNAQTDEAGAVGCSTFHADADADQFGAPGKTACLCIANADFPVSNGADCNDGAAAVSPVAVESCNGVDDNCDGATDDVNAAGCQTYYADADTDTWGNAALTLCLCAPLGVFNVTKPGDCNDLNAAMYPGKPEQCDGVDNNCDGTVDDANASGCKNWLRDHDGDGYGSASEAPVCLCAASGEFTATVGGDCNDGDNNVHPTAAEICNSIDDDCDGTTDPVNANGCSAWYVDGDGDGYGTYLQNSLCLCKAIAGYAAKAGDCNDSAAAVNPGAVDICNGIDDDCSGSADPKSAPGCKTYFVDGDGDGYGVANLSQCACTPDGAYTATLAGDCNDAVSGISPAATETCNNIDDNCNSQTDEGLKLLFYVDGDGDGWGVGVGLALCESDGYHTALKNGDCNDGKAGINPGTSESCNGTDDNCDGQTDEGLATTLWFKDADGDSYGAAPGVQLCGALGAYTVTVGGDCNDANQSVSPAVAEACNGIDDNCNGSIDEAAATGCAIFYRDGDGDTVGVAGDSQCLCAKAGQYSATVSGDCNDANAAISPKVAETCNGFDDNCDGLIDVPGSQGCTTYYVDADLDSYGSLIAPTQCLCTKLTGFATQAGDCNDNDAAINPQGSEVCNGKDDNCDGVIDPVNAGACVTYYGDGDLDGYGGNLAQCACGPKGAFSALVGGDCNDNAFAINPGVAEVCNGIDDNCNSVTDEGLTKPFYVDSDGDSWGTGVASLLCSASATFPASKSGDCDDSKASINPGATETCNGIDDNCNGATDDGLTFVSYYRDLDNDSYGNANVMTSACSQPAGYVGNSTDCNDNSAAIHPNATEVCNSIDDNCSGSADEGLPTLTYYQDGDGDSFGNSSVSQTKCSPPSGYVLTATDCNDGSATIHPGAAESCNGVDDNCNGSIDEGATSTYYRDVDADGYGNALVNVSACSPPSGYVANATDCDDGVATTHPGAVEICNGVDDNCSGAIDEGLPTTTYYADADGDGYGNFAITLAKCSMPAGYVGNSTDCNDASAAIKPGATEVCNGVDDNCSGSIDEGVTSVFYRDADGDTFGTISTTTTGCAAPQGYVANSTDCDDANAAVKPTASEVCNGIDDNCNSSIDEGVKLTFYHDGDGDTFGTPTTTTQACTAPSGYVANSTDCNDANPAIKPSAMEINCDGIDQDCSGADNCPCPTPAVLNPLESSSNVTSYPGQWWFDTWLKTQGSYSLTFETDTFTCGYGTPGINETAKFNIVIPTGTLFVTADVIFQNYATDTLPDTTAYMLLTMDGASQQLGPYAALQPTTKLVKWPVTSLQWGKTVQMTVTMKGTVNTSSCFGGFAVDNIKSTCN